MQTRAPRWLLTAGVSTLMALSSCEILDTVSGQIPTNSSGLSEKQIVAGLREALSVGIDSASSQVSRLNGYLLNEAIKILLPEDARRALDYVEQLNDDLDGLPAETALLLGDMVPDLRGFAGMRDSLTIALNRAAEQAAPLSVDIFKNAITSLSITEGMEILGGDSVAATTYLEDKTYTPLSEAYAPFVDSTLELVGAVRLWRFLSTNYNTVAALRDSVPSSLQSYIPAPPFDSLETDLGLYATTKALDGLFYVVGEEETRIRRDPVARVTEILETVFGWAEENLS